MNDLGNSGYPQQPRGRGCSGRLLLLLIVVGVWMFASRMRSGSVDENGSAPGPAAPSKQLPDGIPGSGQEQVNSDWTMESVDGDRTSRAMPSTDTKDNGDWSIESVDTTATGQSEDVTLDLGDRKNKRKNNRKGDPKRTKKGDWSIEEVEDKKSS